jgi:hypothetical protein
VSDVEGVVRVGDEVGEDAKVLDDLRHRLALAEHGDGLGGLGLDALAQFSAAGEDEVVVGLGSLLALRARDAGLVRRCVVRQHDPEVGRRERGALLRDPLVGRTGPGEGADREEEEEGEEAFHRPPW